MRLRKIALVLVCAVLLGAFAPVSAFASHYVSNTTNADAWYSSWNYENGEPGPNDATLDWNVSGSSGHSMFNDAGVQLDSSRGAFAWFIVSSYTPASGSTPATWKMADVFSEDPSLVFGKKLSSASLDFIAEGYVATWYGDPWVETAPGEWETRTPDEESNEMISVVANWKATGAPTKSSWMNRERSDGYYWADKNTGTSRTARADVSVVGAGGTAYVTEVAQDASITQQKSVGRQKGDFPY